MRFRTMLLWGCVLGSALAGIASGQAPSPATAPTVASAPTVGVIDFYGLHKLSPDQIRKTLGFKEGDPFPSSKALLEEQLDALPGVVESHLEAVCCDDGRIVLYVGIEERGA